MTVITKTPFGNLSSGEAVSLFRLTNESGAYVEITDFGGAIRSIVVPDKNGVLGDVALGYDDISGYENQTKYIGALIGRHGNRIENAEFLLGGKHYVLAKNDGPNNLHGGIKGFDKVIWDAEIDGESLKLTYVSADGEEGFPGTLTAVVRYTFDRNNVLTIDYTDTTAALTVLHLPNHADFNLDGEGSGLILDPKLTLKASHFTVGNVQCLPNGYVAKVENTPMDFTTEQVIGDRINSDYEQIVFAGGYDHNWCPDGEGYRHIATLKGAVSGRVMEVYTDLPGVQFYAGNFLDGSAPYGKGGKPIEKRSGLCLETQFYPNALMHKNFAQPVLDKGEIYHHVTAYRFRAE